MGYTTNEGMVRVDYFKPKGKWYETLEVDMSSVYSCTDIREGLLKCLAEQYPSFEPSWWNIVCIEPYHKYSHPIMIMANED